MTHAHSLMHTSGRIPRERVITRNVRCWVLFPSDISELECAYPAGGQSQGQGIHRKRCPHSVWSGGGEPVLKQPDLPTPRPKEKEEKEREGKDNQRGGRTGYGPIKRGKGAKAADEGHPLVEDTRSMASDFFICCVFVFSTIASQVTLPIQSCGFNTRRQQRPSNI